MNPKLNAIRALAAYSAQQSLRLFTIAGSMLIAVLFAIVATLSYYFTPWWWIFALPIVVLLLAFLVMRSLVKRIISRLHRHPFTTRQREQLEKFTGELKGLAEIKNTPVYIYAIMTVWDVLRNRDETAIQKLVDSSKSLKSDFANLEKHFGER